MRTFYGRAAAAPGGAADRREVVGTLAVMLGEASGDGIDQPFRPPPGLLDRCWIHPTELAAVTGGRGRPARPGSAAVGLPVLAALLVVAALTVAGVLDATRSPSPLPAVHPAGTRPAPKPQPAVTGPTVALRAGDRVVVAVGAEGAGGLPATVVAVAAAPGSTGTAEIVVDVEAAVPVTAGDVVLDRHGRVIGILLGPPAGGRARAAPVEAGPAAPDGAGGFAGISARDDG